MAEEQKTSRTTSATSATSTSFESTPELEHFKQFYDEAYLYIEQGLSLEELGDGKSAIKLYEKGLLLIDQALSVRTEGRDRDGDRWEKARESQTKLRRVRLEILERLSNVRLAPSTLGPSVSHASNEPPPSYEETMKWDAERNPDAVNGFPHEKDYCNFRDKVQSMNGEGGLNYDERQQFSQIPDNAEAVFTHRDVQIFFISPEGYVTAPSYPTVLTVYKFETNEAAAATRMVPAFIQVGEWIFPLIPGQSPVLQTNYGAYIFPDSSRQQAGSAVGLLFSEDTDEATRMIFEHLLCELTVLKIADETGTARLSRRISEGAEVFARGIGYGAEVTSRLVHIGAQKLRERIEPAGQPSNVDPRLKEGLHVARDVTGVAVRASGFLVRKVGEATLNLGRYLAPHIRKHGTNLLSKALNEPPSSAGNKIDNVLEVASGGFRGFATVFLGLESAARLLASSLANETVTTVHHRYGTNAGDVTDNALHTVGNVAVAAYNINACGVKGIAKKTVKGAAVAMVEDFEQTQPVRRPPPPDKKQSPPEQPSKK